MIRNTCAKKSAGKYFFSWIAAVWCCWLVLGFLPQLSQAAASLQYTAEFPYSIGGRQDIRPGGSFQGRLCLLYTAAEPLAADVALTLPNGIKGVNLPPGWIVTPGGELYFSRQFEGGYENWFELLQFQADTHLPQGQSEILLTITAAGKT
ncbi:MAG: hypothetical protein LBR56_08610, partial [Sporomusaceae bacterium]|nr:hypothetical protein [Sporomusaceae bacterium]